MSILVTGGSGLIGSTLTRMLAEKGEKVWVFDKWIGHQRFAGIEDRVQTIPGGPGQFFQGPGSGARERGESHLSFRRDAFPTFQRRPPVFFFQQCRRDVS